MNAMNATGKWLLRNPLPASPARLFCLPYSGTGASSLRQWPARIGTLEVCPVQLPGRENRIREQPYRDVTRLAADAADGLMPTLDRPYALFGHCMGALLAHALAARLEELGSRPPTLLIVSSAAVPHLPPSRRYRTPSPGLSGFYHPAMSDAELTAEMRNVARALGTEVLPELVPLALRVLRADVELCYAYRLDAPRPVRCPIAALGWTADPEVTPGQMDDWRDYGEVRRHDLDGDKMAYLKAPRALLRVIESDFAAASAVQPAWQV
jgi:surfactin synthase thioesterase subunit